ncbi:MAG: hypothetical protein GY946_05790, partial [bacterium]|nr:hypothetical protein [bacterium]
NFPAFIGGIQSTLTEVDSYQVGVVTTDKYAHNRQNCRELGSLVTQTGGRGSSNSTCGPYAAGANFMTEVDDLPATFTCAATLGVQGGSFERPMQALEETLMKEWNDPGECNETFLRDDALLVVVVITDEADGPGDPDELVPNPQGGPATSPGTPQTWFETVTTAKFGVEENVAVVSLIRWTGGPCEPTSAAFDGQNIKEFTEMFTYGYAGGICEPDYGPIFQQAVSIIATACENYTPPG